MRTVNVTFENDEFDLLVINKKKENWHDFVLKKCLKKEGEKDGDSNNTAT